MPEASRLMVAAAALSAVSAPLTSRFGPEASILGVGPSTPGVVAPGAAAPAGVAPGAVTAAVVAAGVGSALAADFGAFAFASAAALVIIGRDISADFSGVTRMSRDSWPYLASAAASACAQVSALRRQEQVESNDCWNLSALGISTYGSPVEDTACSIVPPNGKE